MIDARGNYFGIFFGYDRIDDFSMIDYNYYLDNGGYNIDFNFYQGSGGWWEPGGLTGIKLIRNGHLAQYPLPQFTGTFTRVKLKYTQSTTNTLMMYYDNSLVFSYDDPNIADWVYSTSKKGKYWGFQAIQGGATLKAYIKSMLLTYQEFEPTATPTTEPTATPTTEPTATPTRMPITSPTFKPKRKTKQPTKKRKTKQPTKKYPTTHKKNQRKPHRHYVYQTHSPSKRPTTTKE